MSRSSPVTILLQVPHAVHIRRDAARRRPRRRLGVHAEELATPRGRTEVRPRTPDGTRRSPVRAGAEGDCVAEVRRRPTARDGAKEWTTSGCSTCSPRDWGQCCLAGGSGGEPPKGTRRGEPRRRSRHCMSRQFKWQVRRSRRHRRPASYGVRITPELLRLSERPKVAQVTRESIP